MLPASPILATAILALLAVAGCASPAADEEAEGASGAIQTGSAFTSPIANGLYSDGTSFLRASRSAVSVGDLAVAVQSVQWDFGDLEQGAGSANVKSDRVEVVKTFSNEAQTLSITTAGANLNVTLTSASRRSAPVHLTLHPVTYASLNRSYVSQFGTFDAIVSQQNTTEDGADITFTGAGAPPSTAHFTWSAYAVALDSKECGGMTFFLNSPSMAIEIPAQSAACASFTKVYETSHDKILLAPK